MSNKKIYGDIRDKYSYYVNNIVKKEFITIIEAHELPEFIEYTLEKKTIYDFIESHKEDFFYIKKYYDLYIFHLNKYFYLYGE